MIKTGEDQYDIVVKFQGHARGDNKNSEIIDHPRPRGEVLCSEQRKLAIFMKLFIRNLALLLHIITNRFFISVPAYGSGKITIRPKLPTPQLLLNLRTALKNFPGCDALDHRPPAPKRR